MENEILVGVKKGNTTNWYRAHSLNRRKDGKMVVFALDEKRTPVVITAAEFSGVTFGNPTAPRIETLIPQL